MWGNTPVWDGIKRQSGCYVNFYEKYINFEKRLTSSWLTFLFPFLLIFSKFIRRKRTRHWLKIMLDLEQSFKSASPWENLSKTEPCRVQSFRSISQSRCSKMQSVADGKRQCNVPINFSISGRFVPTAWALCPIPTWGKMHILHMF